MKRIVSVLSGALLLAACDSGGGGGGGAVVTPTPSPTPAPSPTPTPTPTPTYTRLIDIPGDFNFDATCVPFIANSTPPLASVPSAFGQGFALSYVATTQTYTMAGEGQTFSFGPADVDPAAPAGAKAYLKPAMFGSDRFNIGATGISGTGGAAGTPLDYVGRATLVSSSFGGANRNYSCIYGAHTLPTDVPAGTVFPYTPTGMSGLAYVRPPSSATLAYSLTKSTVTISANLSTLKVETVLTLVGAQLPAGSGPDVNLGVITGTADIDPDTGGFYGTWSSTDREAIGNFSGGFFGPQGREVAFVYGMNGRDASAVLNFSSTGIVVGKR